MKLKRIMPFLLVLLLSLTLFSACGENGNDKENNPLFSVMYSKKKFIDERGNSVYLKDYILGTDRVYNSEYYAVPKKYALVDFNSDGTDELVVYVTPSYSAHMVFRIYNDNVYGYEFHKDRFVEIKEDGTILQISKGTERKYSKLEFTDDKCEMVGLSYRNNLTNEYKLNAYYASREEVAEFENEMSAKTCVSWIDCKNVEYFIAENELAIDITFDLKSDIVVPHDRTERGVFYKAYVWVEEQGEYVYADGFEKYPNVCIDTEGKMLLTSEVYHRPPLSNSNETDEIPYVSYRVIEYTDNAFESTRNVYWESFENNTKICFEERTYYTGAFSGEYITHKKVTLDQSDIMNLDKNDERIKEYFVPGSFWDLDGAKWKNYIYNYENE